MRERIEIKKERRGWAIYAGNTRLGYCKDKDVAIEVATDYKDKRLSKC